MPGKTVLLTGATGALGAAVIRAFQADGWSCRTVSRKTPAPGTPAAPLPHCAIDITDRAALQAAMNGADVVVHMAALLHIPNPEPSMEAEYRRANVDGTAAVLDAARQAGVARVVFTSSICVYGSTRTGLLDEQSVTEPDTLYGRTKLEAEHSLLNTAPARPEAVVLRLAAVYGPGIKGNYDRLVRAIARRRFIPVGRGGNRRTLLYEDDAGRAIVLAASHPAAAGRTFNVVGGIHTVTEIAGAIASSLDRWPPPFTIPLAAARLAIAAVESGCRLAGRTPPVTRATLEKYTEDVAVSGHRIRDELGFEPQISLRDGWRRAIEGMKADGRL